MSNIPRPPRPHDHEQVPRPPSAPTSPAAPGERISVQHPQTAEGGQTGIDTSSLAPPAHVGPSQEAKRNPFDSVRPPSHPLPPRSGESAAQEGDPKSLKALGSIANPVAGFDVKGYEDKMAGLKRGLTASVRESLGREGLKPGEHKGGHTFEALEATAKRLIELYPGKSDQYVTGTPEEIVDPMLETGGESQEGEQSTDAQPEAPRPEAPHNTHGQGDELDRMDRMVMQGVVVGPDEFDGVFNKNTEIIEDPKPPKADEKQAEAPAETAEQPTSAQPETTANAAESAAPATETADTTQAETPTETATAAGSTAQSESAKAPAEAPAAAETTTEAAAPEEPMLALPELEEWRRQEDPEKYATPDTATEPDAGDTTESHMHTQVAHKGSGEPQTAAEEEREALARRASEDMVVVAVEEERAADEDTELPTDAGAAGAAQAITAQPPVTYTPPTPEVIVATNALTEPADAAGTPEAPAGTEPATPPSPETPLRPAAPEQAPAEGTSAGAASTQTTEVALQQTETASAADLATGLVHMPTRVASIVNSAVLASNAAYAAEGNTDGANTGLHPSIAAQLAARLARVADESNLSTEEVLAAQRELELQGQDFETAAMIGTAALTAAFGAAAQAANIENRAAAYAAAYAADAGTGQTGGDTGAGTATTGTGTATTGGDA